MRISPRSGSIPVMLLMASSMLPGCSTGDSDATAGDLSPTDVMPQTGPSQQAVDRQAVADAPRSNARAVQRLPQDVYQMSQARIMDPSGFDKPMLAATVLIPSGWRAQGGVVWGAHGQCGDDYASRWEAVSPDGASAMSVLPMPKWEGVRTSFPNPARGACPEAHHLSVRAYLEATVRQLFPQGRVLDYRSLDDEVKPLRDMLAQLPALPPTQGFDARMNIEAGELLVAFTENGRDMRAAVSATAVISHSRVADLMNPSQIAMESVSGFPSNFTVVKAPNGELDLGLRRRVATSLRLDPEWSRRINEFNARKQAAAARSNREMRQASQAAHEARMQNLRETSDIINGMYEDRQLSSDRQQRERIEAIRGVETYNDPVAGTTVQLDNNYQHAWRVRNQDNTYILTNDVNFNPGAYDIDAQQLKPLP